MSPKKPVPYRQERLRIVVSCTLGLMMNVMISRIVVEENMEDITGKPESTVIIDGFDHGETEEEDGCPSSHPGDKEGDGPTDVVKQTLKWMIIEGTECERNNQSVMLRVDTAIQKLVVMHIAVNEVLPRVHDEHGDDELQSLD